VKEEGFFKKVLKPSHGMKIKEFSLLCFLAGKSNMVLFEENPGKGKKNRQEKGSRISEKPCKKPLNAYLLFCKDRRGQVLEENPGLTMTQLNGVLSNLWNDLDSDQKAEYKIKSEKLRLEFRGRHPDYRYQRSQKKSSSAIGAEPLELDSLQLLNHMFQRNPLLLQQMLSEKGESGRPNIRRLFFPG
jgi:hypothetical protein